MPRTNNRRSIKDPRKWLDDARERRRQLIRERRTAARGALINRVRRQQRLLGFVTDVEGTERGPWFIKLECMDKRWMEEVFRELRNTIFDLSEFEETAEVPLLSGDGLLGWFLGNLSFPNAFEQASVAQRYALGAVRRWFVDRTVGGPDGSESLPQHSIYEARVDVTMGNAPPMLGQWLQITIWPPQDPGNWDDVNGTWVELPDEEPFIGPPQPMQIRQLNLYDEPWQGILQALHFPAPEGDEIELEEVEDELGDDDLPPFGHGGGGFNGNFFREAFDELRRRVRAWIEGLTGGPGWQPQPALAGAGWLALDLASDEQPPRMRVRAYVGSPKAAPLAAAGQPNPMIGGGQQAFVGLIDVGQGNCNVIVDSNWRILAYYDFGHSVRGDEPDELPPLCFCHNPYIILSHWDQDHYMLHSKNPECYRATWIVPRQGTGNLGTSVTGKVKRAGGQVHVWAAGHPSHMAFPWGFVERCEGNPQGNDRNSSGLAVYVCCKNRPANPTTPGTAAWSVAGPVNSLVTEASSAFTSRARAAVGGAGAGVLARCLASVLGNSRFGNTLTPANCTLAATQAEANAAAQVGGGAPVPDPPVVAAAAMLGLATVPAGNARNRAAQMTAVAAIAVDAAMQVGSGSENWAASCPFGIAAQPAMAAGTVNGELGVLGYAINAGKTSRAQRVAAALRASSFGNYLTDAQAANAACRAVESVLVALAAAAASPGHAALAAAAAANNALNNLPNTPTQRVRAGRELTVAAVAGYMANRLGLPEDLVGHCVAGGFVPDAAANNCWPQSVVGGLRPAPGAGDVPQVRLGAAPTDPGERYILLTGDANFNVIPSCKANPPPVVVGLEAMHHGSFIEGGDYLHGDTLPWAPGSAPAVATHHAEQANGAHARTITIACAAAHSNVAPPGATVTTADHVGAAAAAAIVAADAAGHGPHMLFDEQTADLIALAAASAAYAAYRNTGARVVGASILIVFGLTKTNPPPLPLSMIYTAATNLVAAVAGPGVDANLVAHETRGCVGISGNIDFSATVAAGITHIAGLANVLNGANADAAAQAAVTHGLPPTYLAYAAVAGAIARAAVLGVAAVPGVGAEATAAGVGGRAGEVTTAITHRPANGFNPKPDLATALADASRGAAEGVAAHIAGSDAETVSLACDAVLANIAGNASAVHGLPAASRIAYSYGVTATGKHTYRSDNLAKYGHAHPPAIALYEAKGWTDRRNVCARASANNVHPGHHDQHDPGNPAGHVTLCWDPANDQQVVAGVINYVCPDCGAAITFNV